jgi:hypothetical protein
VDSLGLATSFFLGIRHCLEADHLAAMAQFASAAPTARHGLRSGLLWGLGHGAAVLALFAAFSSVTPSLMLLEGHAERAAGLTLIGLSIWRLRAFLRRPHAHEHRHAGGVVHAHEHRHDLGHAHVHAPTVTGLVHGTAGAAGLLALFSVGPSAVWMAGAFSLGTLLAMGVAGWAAARLYSHESFAVAQRAAVGVTAVSGLVIGLVWVVNG